MKHNTLHLLSALRLALRDICGEARPRGRAEWWLLFSLVVWFAALVVAWLSASDGVKLVMGYDSSYCLTDRFDCLNVRDWYLRHPLMCLLYSPFSLLSKIIGGHSFVYIGHALGVVWLSLGGLCAFKLARRFRVPTCAAVLSTAMLASCAYIMVLAWQVETFTFSAFLLPLSVLVVTGTRRTSTDNLMLLLLSGVTLTNGAKLLIAFCLVEGSVKRGVRRAIRALPLFLVSISWYFPLILYRIFVKHADAISTIFNESLDCSKPLFSLAYRVEAFFSCFFAEGILFHFDSFAQYIDRHMVPPYGNPLCYVAIAAIGVALLAALWKNRRSRLAGLFAAYVGIDFFVCFVMGFGIDEAQIYSVHYLFFVPVIISMLCVQGSNGTSPWLQRLGYGCLCAVLPLLVCHNLTVMRASLDDIDDIPRFTAYLGAKVQQSAPYLQELCG